MAAVRSGLIQALEREWRDALCTKDIDRLRALMHPQFRMIGIRSTRPFLLTREEWLDAIKDREVLGIETDLKDSVEFDHLLVATSEARWRVSYLGQTVEDCVLLTDVWLFDEGRWRVVRRHLSPMPTAECLESKH